MTVRPILLRLHRYVGLLIALFIIVASLTGAALTFYQELDLLLNRHRLAITPMPGTPDALRLREAVEQMFPGIVSHYVALDLEATKPAVFYVESVEESSSLDFDEVFLHPVSGELLMTRRWGDLTQGMVNLIPFLYSLHYSLALGEIGIILLGVVAVLWFLDCFNGAFLTFPVGTGATGQSGRAKSWLRRWSAAWFIRISGVFRFVFTSHRAFGLWLWALLAVIAFSAAALSFPNLYKPAIGLLLQLDDPRGQLPMLDEPRPLPSMAWQTALTTGRSLMTELASEEGFEVHAETGLNYHSGSGLFRYIVRSSRDPGLRFAATSVWFDSETGARRLTHVPTGRGAGDTFTTWLHGIHFADVGGLPFRVFMAGAGIAICWLTMTGVWIWLRKRTGKSPKKIENFASAAKH